MPKKEIKVATIVGARPQFIKAATVTRALQKYNKKDELSIIKELNSPESKKSSFTPASIMTTI